MEKIKLSVEKESKEVEMEFVEIPGKNIAMLKTELTQAMYGAVMKEYPCMFPGASSPIESISWYDAIYFCNKLSVMKGKEPVYAVNDEKDITKWNYTPHEDERVKGHITQDSHASGFRLPTLEEQQYAAKGGENCKTPGPDDVERVVYDGVTHPVGEGKSNGYGLYGLNDALEANPSCCTEENKDVYGVNFGSDYGKRPVENVTWYDAVFYCNARSEKEGLDAVYKIENPEIEENHIVSADVTCDLSQNGYRLPTEAEWEYAAHGGNNPSTANWNYIFSGIDTDSGIKYDSNFNSALDSVGWYCYNNKDGTTSKKDSTTSADGCGTHEVGLKAANVLGLYDMSGNVFEWCWDIFDDISSEAVDNPLGPDSGNYRVGRGGSWNVNAKRASVAFRMNLNPRGRSSSIGFRVVRNCETSAEN